MSIVKDKKNGKFYISYKLKQLDGTFKTVNIKRKEWTLDVGIRYMKSIEYEMIEQDKRKRNRNIFYGDEITIDNLIDKFFKSREADGFSMTTLYNQNSILEKTFRDYLNKGIYVSELFNIQLADEIKINLTNQLTTSSTNMYLSTIRNFIEFAAKRKCCNREIAYDMIEVLKRVRGAEPQKDNFFVNGEDDLRAFEKSFEEVDKEYYVPIMTIFYGALRIGEWQALKVSDFDFANSRLSITKQYNQLKVVVNNTKNKKDRYACLPKQFSEMLKNYIDERRLNDDDFLFTYNGNKPMSRRLIQLRINKHLEMANLQHMTIHGLRHSFATRMFDKGYNVKQVQEQLGHTNMNTTMQYYIHYTKSKEANNLDDLF